MTTRQPTTKKPATKKPAAKKPAAKKPAAKKPATKKPATKKPAAKKPAAKKPAAKKPGDGMGVGEKAYTLGQLVEAVPASVGEGDVQARVALLPAELKAIGRRVSTERIASDAARVLGTALDFVDAATPAQRQALLGLSRRTLEVAIFAAHRDASLWQQRSAAMQTQANLQKLRGVEAEEILRQGRGRREQLFEALLAVAGGQPTRTAEVEADYGQRGTPALLARSLRDLARRGRGWLGAGDAALRVRLGDTQLDEALLADTERLAGRVEQLGPAAEAPRSRVGVSQDQVDLWDGYTLVLFERVVRVFEAGRLVDPTVPRLVPIALHRWYYGKRGASQLPPAPPEPTPAGPR